jgi:hypothetical protein
MLKYVGEPNANASASDASAALIVFAFLSSTVTSGTVLTPSAIMLAIF